MVRTGETARVRVLGSHGEVGRQVAALLRASGHMVNCGNRSHHTSDERTAIVDAHDEESVNKFSRDLDVVVNCAGPSCLLKTSVASALPDSVGYIDPFGANSFDNYPTNGPDPRKVDTSGVRTEYYYHNHSRTMTLHISAALVTSAVNLGRFVVD